MKVDLMTFGAPLRRAQQLAQDAASAGFDGLVVTEGGRTAYLTCAAAALGADLDLATGIAVAFPRSPMVSAQVAWELADASGGRFRLGLGTQVKAHIVRRYDAPFDHPGPRLREYVEAVRACFAAFRGAPLDYDGEYYSLSLLTPQWSPGPIEVDDPPIDIAAVNPYLLRVAGEVADGVHVHPLNHRAYLESTVVPNVRAGMASAGRGGDDPYLIVPVFTAVGDTDEAQHRWRETARAQIAFYGSTPNYAFVFEQLGRDGTTARLRERQKAGDLAGMVSVVDDDLLDHFVVTGTFEQLPALLVERYEGLAARLVMYFAGAAWAEDPHSLARWGEVAHAVRDRTARA